MGNEITSTHEIAEGDWDGSSEPSGVDTDMVATKEPEGRGIVFHVSMRDYTQRDMEDLIVEAAARTIVGRHNDRELARKIEAKCVELINAKATDALAKVTAEIIDQPMTPQFAGAEKSPVTMRDFIGLYGREYLTAKVDRHTGEVCSSSYHAVPRIEYLVSKFMDTKFKNEIEKATNAAIREIQAAITSRHSAILDAEKARLRDALARAAGVPA